MTREQVVATTRAAAARVMTKMVGFASVLPKHKAELKDLLKKKRSRPAPEAPPRKRVKAPA